MRLREVTLSSSQSYQVAELGFKARSEDLMPMLLANAQGCHSQVLLVIKPVFLKLYADLQGPMIAKESP